MSAIAGIINFGGAAVADSQIGRMTAAMAARGPDGSGHWINANVAFGHCLLQSTPESLDETQPVVSIEAGVVLVLDGRIDNWQELRKDLQARDVVLRTQADAELVLQAWLVWGDGFLSHLAGDFALALWDARTQTLHFARDRTGNRPLYYHWNGTTLVFASAVNAILQLPQIPQKVNKAMLAQYLASQWFTEDATLWEGVQRLRPAEYLRASQAGVQGGRYWQVDVEARIRYPRIEEYREHFRELFTDIVRRMSRSQHPLACEVSGGLDSSGIFGMTMHLQRQQQLLAPGIEGYTLAFQHDAEANEVDYCRDVARFWNKNIREIAPSFPSLSWYRQQAVAGKTVPYHPNTAMSLGLLDAARGANSKVVLAGTGGDEWLGGYRNYYADTLSHKEWQALWFCLRRDVREFGWAQSLQWLLVTGVLPQLPFALRTRLRRLITPRKKWGVDREAWLSPQLRKLLEQSRPPLPQQPQIVGRPGHRTQLNSLHEYEHQLGREMDERMYADAGLDLRMPFWDVRMVQFAFATPEYVRLQGGVDRALFRQSMTDLLPASVLNRQSKADFTGCFHHHIPAMRQLLTVDITTRRADWINRKDAEQMYAMASDPRHQGWPELLLWVLFGCDAVIE